MTTKASDRVIRILEGLVAREQSSKKTKDLVSLYVQTMQILNASEAIIKRIEPQIIKKGIKQYVPEFDSKITIVSNPSIKVSRMNERDYKVYNSPKRKGRPPIQSKSKTLVK